MNTLPPHAQDGNTPQKRCTKCKEFKPATFDYFHSDKKRRDGLFPWCKICRYTYNKVPPEKNRITQRKYDASHIAEKRQYYAVHAGDIAEHGKQYRQTDVGKAKVKARDYRRRARQNEALGKHTATDIRNQYAAQKGKCYYCKAKVGTAYHVDHIIPLSRGGSNDPSNLVVACPTCNLSKSNKLLHEWTEGGMLL